MERTNTNYASYSVLYSIDGVDAARPFPIAKATSKEDAIKQINDIMQKYRPGELIFIHEVVCAS